MLTFGKDDPKTNIRAGVYWLCYKAARFTYMQVDDSLTDQTYRLGWSESLSKIAAPLHTTTPVILHDSKLTLRDATRLKPGDNLHYHQAHMEWKISRWVSWEDAVFDYNGQGDGQYLQKFGANLQELRGGFPASSQQ